MRTMKDSGIEWIGQIPQEWDVRKIKHCFNVYAGATPKSGNSEFWDGDIVWVTPADYTTEQKYVSEGRKSITSEGFESCSTEMIPAGSLIFSKRAPIGLVAINTVDLCTNQGCLSCVPLDKNDVEYFYYAFSSFTEQFDLYGSGTTFKEISADAFVNFPIPCPTIETQRNISEYLRNRCAEIDALIAAKEKTNALLKERRQSIIYEAVTKGLNPDAPMKDSGIEWIGQIPEHWTVKKIKYLGTFRNGLTYSPDNVTNEESGTLVLRSSNIQNGNVVFDDNVYVDMDIPEILQVAAGDILICSRNGSRELIGKNAIIPENVKASFGAFMMVFRCGDPKYLYYILNSNVFSYYLGTFLTSTVNQLTAANFGNMKVVYCDSAEEREEIVAHLDQKCEELDAAISTNEATIQKLKEYRQSIIYEAVTGKIEI